MKPLLDLQKFELSGGRIKTHINTVDHSLKDIAIIGIHGQFASAGSIQEFWEMLREGRDGITDFPMERQAYLSEYLQGQGLSERMLEDLEYHAGGYLKDISSFDYELFGISPKEAGLMDPNQRLFLQAAWAALEDAGYGGDKCSGSQTGVYAGHNNDFGEDYKSFIQVLDRDAMEISAIGNLKSIIPSRISYLLDLKGPSCVVDTACSSALVAVHLACRALRSGECDMALAGGVKLHLLPIKRTNAQGIGLHIVNNVEAHDGKAKTFDDTSDGTGLGEGAAVIVLKPLTKALEDKDHIYAVIKGSAMNQDGRSMGITAPNSSAQEQLIMEAWKDAGIDPESVSYIEAHGTGTKLGDPIEIHGIERAFAHFTDKKQFCAVGSVKTNIGHLDNAAGMAGLLKAVLALKHRQIPPTLRFNQPNRNISFVDSPVFVADQLLDWDSREGARRCGVSSFGLSGTNCHIVLEEAPAREERMTDRRPVPPVVTFSAKSRESLREWMERYIEFARERSDTEDYSDFVYSANTGRGHYRCRLAVMSRDWSELCSRLELIREHGLVSQPEAGLFYGEHKVIPAQKTEAASGEITSSQAEELSAKASRAVGTLAADSAAGPGMLLELCEAYVQGAEVDWESLYLHGRYHKIPLPVYPFKRESCWVRASRPAVPAPLSKSALLDAYPLLDHCLAESNGMDIYSTTIHVSAHWVVRDHKIKGNYVLPGTAYLEMVKEIWSYRFGERPLYLANLTFVSPLILGENESREVHTLWKTTERHIEVIISSRADEEWTVHAEGVIELEPWSQADKAEIMARADAQRWSLIAPKDQASGATGEIAVGGRWKNVRELRSDGQAHKLNIELPSEFEGDMKAYHLHPALIDCAVNGANAWQSDDLYLPYRYGATLIRGNAPQRFHSYLVRKDKPSAHSETMVFDIVLADESGAPFMTVQDYTVKKVHPKGWTSSSLREPSMYYRTGWVPAQLDRTVSVPVQTGYLVFLDHNGLGRQLSSRLQAEGAEIVEVSIGQENREISRNQYLIDGSRESYEQLMARLKTRGLQAILHCLTLDKLPWAETAQDLEKKQQAGPFSLFYIARSLIHNKWPGELDLFLISNHVNNVTGEEAVLNPAGKSLFAAGKVLQQEHSHLNCRCLDIELDTSPELILAELAPRQREREAAYRSGCRYAEELREAPLPEGEGEPLRYHSEGVYVITGGTGGLGLEIGKHMARQANVQLALIHRSFLPEPSEWETLLQANRDRRLCPKIASLLEIRQYGASVTCIQADVNDEEAVQAAIKEIRHTLGPIRGVIHAAGVAGDGFLFRKEEHAFRSVHDTKVQGAWNLYQATVDDDLDFFVMFSSISSLVATPGQADYTAANAYLDTLAANLRKRGRKALSINWGPWKEVGMAADHEVDTDQGAFRGIGTSLGVSAFDKALDSGLDRLAAAELNDNPLESLSQDLRISERLSKRLTRMRKPASGTNPGSSGSGPAQTAIILHGRDARDINETERGIAEAWSRVLGVYEMDLYDSFYNLGGDSIMATKLLKELNARFSGAIDISDIFTYPTIAELAQLVDGKKATQPAAAGTLAEILDRLSKGEITEAEADEYMNQLNF
ncbi:SDR family NAD(P)-dependent oxidoreductase [Paenibacillus glufosinatiresistens]|uniref:SDR family NAD(P)-dependent oxidoreductase n=1 Tax=Paenibacillus glufosinatiresistens TaxID=3070657 RepID=UPI00286DD9F0|nr:SDR family NAD(P)-dependent oxidoreductase [Paenibacillus sp. YX.27]